MFEFNKNFVKLAPEAGFTKKVIVPGWTDIFWPKYPEMVVYIQEDDTLRFTPGIGDCGGYSWVEPRISTAMEEAAAL